MKQEVELLKRKGTRVKYVEYRVEHVPTGRRVGLLGLCLMIGAVVLTGCSGGKKAALTDEEIEKLTYAPKPQRADQLIVCGAVIACDDVMTTLPEESAGAPPLREKLIEYARLAPLETFLAEARPQLHRRLNNSITRVVLFKQAERELGENVGDTLDKLAEKELRRYILEKHGGNEAKADEALQKRSMSRVTYKEQKKRQILAQHVATTKYLKDRPITYSDLVTQYEAMRDEEFLRKGVLQIRLIEIDAAKVELEDLSDDPARVASEQAQELRKRIDAGEDFATLAKEYSHGYRSAAGGLWKALDPEALAAPYDVLARQSQEMEPGQIAGPIDARGRFFIMKVEQKQTPGYSPLTEVQEQVRRAIVADRRAEALKELEVEIARQAVLADTNRFVDYCLQRLYRIANESKPAQGPQPPASEAP